MSNKTYAELVQNLQDWMEDDDVEFTGSIDEIINLAEMRLWRDLDLAIFTSDDSANTAVGNPIVTKPSTDTELVSWQSIYFPNGTGKNVYLELRGLDFVRDHQTPGTNGVPRYYAEVDDTTIELSPIPDQIYVLAFHGVTRPTRLSAVDTTTWLSLHQDDLLFKACKAEAEGFLKSDDRVGMWTEQYNAALPLAKRETYTMLQNHYQLTPFHVPGVPTIGR